MEKSSRYMGLIISAIIFLTSFSGCSTKHVHTNVKELAHINSHVLHKQKYYISLSTDDSHQIVNGIKKRFKEILFNNATCLRGKLVLVKINNFTLFQAMHNKKIKYNFICKTKNKNLVNSSYFRIIRIQTNVYKIILDK